MLFGLVSRMKCSSVLFLLSWWVCLLMCFFRVVLSLIRCLVSCCVCLKLVIRCSISRVLLVLILSSV